MRLTKKTNPQHVSRLSYRRSQSPKGNKISAFKGPVYQDWNNEAKQKNIILSHVDET